MTLLLFLNQNRSTLFPILLIAVWVFIHIKTKIRTNQIIVKTFVIGSTIIILILIGSNLNELINETAEQFNDPDYARIKAIVYFIFEGSPNIFCDIFGNGLISAKTSSIVEDLKEIGIFSSDVGFIGYWHEFGLISTSVLLIIFISAIINKGTPSYLKYISFQILVCSLTISYFALPYTILYFGLFYYLYFYSKAKYTKLIAKHNEVNNSPHKSN